METGAVITAAGMSSRMGRFKPLLSIGSDSIAQRIIRTIQEAGIRKIVVVTGHNADELERHLSGSGVGFLRNELYETTQMFDSASIGFRHLVGACDRILFTPVDIPLFSVNTVKALMGKDAPLVIPTSGGRRGHPILLSKEAVRGILADSGEGGLKGAYARCKIAIVEVAVDDGGILQDADSPADYRMLVDYYDSRSQSPF
jgi:molybdenum cofactor cytidylyltransferase